MKSAVRTVAFWCAALVAATAFAQQNALLPDQELLNLGQRVCS
jgi:hypothetical protein